MTTNDNKRRPVTFTMDPAVVSALREEAVRQSRSISNCAEFLLRQALGIKPVYRPKAEPRVVPRLKRKSV